MITTIGFDADDTLWHNESIFAAAHDKYRALLARWHDAGTVDRRLFATEMGNLELYGYGIKAHALSCIETAIELSGGDIRAAEIREIIAYAKEMLAHPVELLPDVNETIPRLAQSFQLFLITKGDLRDQERKLAKSGLAHHFKHNEVVAEKDVATYARVLHRLQIPAGEFLMVGNSLKSDILPALELGAYAALIPYHLLWAGEQAASPPAATNRFFQLQTLGELPALVARLNAPG
ncbi:MAG TPA: HAD family hydrolase [Opitutaceae bacterium]|nr:HAD family hydrolase [Opitutaceae bacterium]